MSALKIKDRELNKDKIKNVMKKYEEQKELVDNNDLDEKFNSIKLKDLNKIKLHDVQKIKGKWNRCRSKHLSVIDKNPFAQKGGEKLNLQHLFTAGDKQPIPFLKSRKGKNMLP